jgi:hypothetical protein
MRLELKLFVWAGLDDQRGGLRDREPGSGEAAGRLGDHHAILFFEPV